MRPKPQLRCMQNPLVVNSTSASICWRSSLPADAIFSNSSLIKYLIARFPEGNVLLKAVGGQKPREIAAEVLNRANTDAPNVHPLEPRGRDFVEDILEAAFASTQMSPADRRLCQE